MKHEHINGWSNMGEQGELLKYIIKELDYPKELKMAEIGVYLGRGTAIFDEVLKESNTNCEYYAIDHFQGSPEHKIAGNIPSYEKAKENLSPIIHKIKLINNDSISESENYSDGYFDVVYIDATHEYDLVKSDISAWIGKVRKGGFICGDDYIGGWPGVVRAVNEFFAGRIKVIGHQQWAVRLN